MDYTINPSWFYWISVFAAMKVLCLVVGMILLLTGLATTFMYINRKEEDVPTNTNARNTIVRLANWSFRFILLGIFIPDKETYIEMTIAKLVTYDNAQTVIESIKSAADYIIEALK